MTVFASRRPAASAIVRPVAAEPVNETRSTAGSSTSGIPASGPRPCTTFRTPGGSPASRQRRPNHQAETGACSDGLSTDAVPAEDRGKRLPGDVRERRVEGDQQRGDADRPAKGQHGAMRHRGGRRPPVGAAPLTGDEEAHLDRRVGLAERELERLARLGGDDLARLLAPVAQELGDRADDVPAVDRRSRAPLRLRLARGCHRRGRVVRARPRDAAEMLAVGGRRLVEPRAARGRPLVARDEVRHLAGDHQADQPPSTTRLAPGDVRRGVRRRGRRRRRPPRRRPSAARAASARRRPRRTAPAGRSRSRAASAC